jgi:hypothetical protein
LHSLNHAEGSVPKEQQRAANCVLEQQVALVDAPTPNLGQGLWFRK